MPLAFAAYHNINFLLEPAQRNLVAEVWLIKLGKRPATGDIGIRSDGREEMFAHASATYSAPPKAKLDGR